MFIKVIFNNQKFLIFLLAFFSLAVNQFYGNRGVFPIESFAFFDTAYRILLGDEPFKDYWAVSGVFIDYTQSLLFKIFGTNFQIYILHASIINCLLTIMTFFFSKSLNINLFYSFFYSLTFSLLAYTTSGSLYVDNHSSLICLAATYCLIFGIKKNEIKYFFLIPVLIVLAFFTKPAPTIYVFLFFLIFLLFFIIQFKNYKALYTLLFSSIFSITSILIFFYLRGIPAELILQQYFYFPITIADTRYDNIILSFDNIFLNFKFIYFFLIPIIIINVKNLIEDRKFFFSNDFLIFIVLSGFVVCLMFHQLNTKNQFFILFLIPILGIFLHSCALKKFFGYRNFLILFFFISHIIFSSKYHIRYNENRKFHEMTNVNFNLAKEAKLIDKKLTGLNWITPTYYSSPETEIKLILNTLEILKNEKKKKMIITNYSFFSGILEQNTHSPSRWFISNGGAYPIIGNKYFYTYKEYLNNLINKKNIKSVFIIFPVKEDEFLRYIDNKCFKKVKLNEITIKYEIIDKCF